MHGVSGWTPDMQGGTSSRKLSVQQMMPGLDISELTEPIVAWLMAEELSIEAVPHVSNMTPVSCSA